MIRSDEIIEICGDDNGIMSAIGQLLFNAIKYAFGSSYIKMAITKKRSNDVQVSIFDRGMQLNYNELDKVWEFGYRGKEAYERHVNGASIGLYTVKKIISAHKGIVTARNSIKSKNVVIFTMTIPVSNILEKEKLLQTSKK